MATATKAVGILARYPGRCPSCSLPICVDQLIARGPNGFGHVDCDVNREESEAAEYALWERKNSGVADTDDGITLDALPGGRSFYAVPDPKGVLLFLAVDRPTKGKWDGWTFVRRYLGGQGPADKLGSARPHAAYHGAAPDVLATVVADPKAAMKAFADELGVCAKCHRDLTDPVSRERGIGPECWKAVA